MVGDVELQGSSSALLTVNDEPFYSSTKSMYLPRVQKGALLDIG